jgi:hypothetical protein
MDYKKMLSAYIRHIIDEEGVDYLNFADETLTEFGLSAKEFKELKRIANKWLEDDLKHDLSGLNQPA